MYQQKNWWHNYQIYRGKNCIFDNTPNKTGTPCFAYLPWEKLQKGDRLHLEVWAPDNHSAYFTKEQVIKYLTEIQRIRALEFKMVVEEDRVFTVHWYFSKLQMFSALSIVRYCAEDNWNQHHMVAKHVIANAGKKPILKLIEEGHLLQAEDGGGYNSGHAILYKHKKIKPIYNRQLEKMKKSGESINYFWSK